MGTDNQIESQGSPVCWYCGVESATTCACGRWYCGQHGYEDHCMLCALGLGVYESKYEPEPVSGLISYSLSVRARDPYLVVPPVLRGARPLSIEAVENTVAVLVKMISSSDENVRRRAASVLAAVTNSWPSMDPSPLAKRNYGISLLAADQLRRWLLYILKQSRSLRHEAVALAVLEKLQTADFRDLYPVIQEEFALLKCSPVAVRVRDVFDVIGDIYPTQSSLVNERCELTVYAHYADRTHTEGAIMERIYGPLLKYSPILGKMLKKGTWLSNQARYEEWYFGEDEPL